MFRRFVVKGFHILGHTPKSFVFGATVGTGIATYKWCTSNTTNCTSPLPRVCASVTQNVNPNDFEEEDNFDNSRVKSFNFIADAVEKAAPAIVFIEVEGR